DRVWNGIHRSLHSRRKWYTATGVLLLFTTMLFISIEIVSTGDRHINPAHLLSELSLNTASNKNHTIPTVPGNIAEIQQTPANQTQNLNRNDRQTNIRPFPVSSPVNYNSDLLVTGATRLSS